MALIGALGAPAALAGIVWGTIERPLTGAVALLAMLLAAYRNRHMALTDSDTFVGRLIYTAIAGGMVGEALTYLVFSVPPGAPTSAPWVILFVVAIGGAIGVLFGAAGLMLLGGLVTIRLLPGMARGVFGRQA